MNKLRKYYSDLQNDANNNFDKVTPDRLKKLVAFTNQEYESHVQQGAYQHLDELSFYQEKFNTIQTLFKDSMNGKVKKSKLQGDVKVILADNFGNAPVGPTPGGPSEQPPQYIKEEQKPKKQFKQEAPPREQKVSSGGGEPKDQLNNFFSQHRADIEKKKVGFKSLIDSIPQAPQKYTVKSKFEMKGSGANEQELMKLSSKLQDLNRKLEEQRETKNFNKGLYESEKRQYENRIRQLQSQLENVNNKESNSEVQSNNHYPVTSYIQPKDNKYNPHRIDYRENNLGKINLKNYQQNGHQIQQIESQENGGPLSVSNQSEHKRKNNFDPERIYEPIRRGSDEDILLKQDKKDKIHFQLPTNYRPMNSMERSNIRFNRSEAENEDKNIEIRSKLSFFKDQVVLYRGIQFDVAIKSFDVFDLSRRKCYIFVNNKDKYDREVEIEYVYDSGYYGVNVIKKLREVKGMRQDREEVQVKLRDKSDFDSMIEVKLKILHTTHKVIKFLLPAMFIEFTSQRPQRSGGSYEKHFVTPYHQFSNVYLAMEVLPFHKQIEEGMEIAYIFARSKNHEGYITLRYKNRGQVEIETIKPWKLFISFLLSSESYAN